jgi:hypothetical protein
MDRKFSWLGLDIISQCPESVSKTDDPNTGDLKNRIIKNKWKNLNIFMESEL